MFKNHWKSRIQHCERSELNLHFEWTKVHEKCQKWLICRVLEKADACGQTVLPDTFERTKIGGNLKCDIFGDF